MVTKTFQHWDARQRKARLETLRDSGTIMVFWRQTPGRSAKILVHAEFEDAHAHEFPQDRKHACL